MHARTFEHNGLDYGNNVEYQTIECALLSVPIIHRHFAETCVTPISGTNIRETGAFIEIDDDNVKEGKLGPNLLNPQGLMAELEDVWHNCYSSRRKAAVELIRNEYSAEALVPVMIERCLG